MTIVVKLHLAAAILHGMFSPVNLSFQLRAQEKIQNLYYAEFLSGLAKFVEEKCPHLRINRIVLFNAIAATEIGLKEIYKDEFQLRANDIRDSLAVDEKASCQIAIRDFGPEGVVMPKLFSPR